LLESLYLAAVLVQLGPNLVEVAVHERNVSERCRMNDQVESEPGSSRKPLVILAVLVLVVLAVFGWGRWQEDRQRECQSLQLQAALGSRPAPDC
jgi:cytochrome c-type biogenesis protein CcmH/NrfG